MIKFLGKKASEDEEWRHFRRLKEGLKILEAAGQKVFE